MPASGHDNTIEKPGIAGYSQRDKRQKTIVYRTDAGRFLITVRGPPRAHAGRPQKTMVCPTATWQAIRSHLFYRP
jgi:hypothetical protein